MDKQLDSGLEIIRLKNLLLFDDTISEEPNKKWSDMCTKLYD